MKNVILLSPDPNFFDPLQGKSLVNRRDMLPFPAVSVKEAEEIIKRVPSIVLVIADGISPGKATDGLAGLIERWPEMLFVFLSPKIPTIELPPVEKVMIINEPFNCKYITLMVRRLIGVAERTYYKTLIQFKRLKEKSPQILFGFSVNIEPNGLLLQTETELQIGEALGLNFVLPNGGRNVELRGIVVRQVKSSEEGLRFGIRLMDTPVSIKEAIEDFCRTKPLEKKVK